MAVTTFLVGLVGVGLGYLRRLSLQNQQHDNSIIRLYKIDGRLPKDPYNEPQDPSLVEESTVRKIKYNTDQLTEVVETPRITISYTADGHVFEDAYDQRIQQEPHQDLGCWNHH